MQSSQYIILLSQSFKITIALCIQRFQHNKCLKIINEYLQKYLCTRLVIISSFKFAPNFKFPQNRCSHQCLLNSAHKLLCIHNIGFALKVVFISTYVCMYKKSTYVHQCNCCMLFAKIWEVFSIFDAVCTQTCVSIDPQHLYACMHF